MQFTTSVIIDQPVERVFQYVLEPRNMKQWMQGFQSFESGKGRRRRVGSQAVQVFKEPDGQLTKVEEEVLLREPNENLRLFLSHRNMRSTVNYRFMDQGGKTKLIVEVDARLQPFIFNLFTPFVKGPMKRRQQADLQRLKDALEKND